LRERRAGEGERGSECNQARFHRTLLFCSGGDSRGGCRSRKRRIRPHRRGSAVTI